MQPERRDQQGDQERRGEHGPQQRPAQHAADHVVQKRDSPSRMARRLRNGIRPRSIRSPSFESIAGSTVSEPSSAIATTSIVPKAEALEHARAHEEHAGHRGHHGQAGDEHRAAGRRRRDLERGGSASGPRARSSR